ncbi:Cmx/CmrA family chloramphenicol efflux MFS transporter [Streptomyces sp. SID5785]|uniref:Cmx/CmrA family chloramphenicol efflux MFS transporter n=1 Tax=Streptomyces sp. SID5785 TaxID=2690309 RepID=UPI001360DF5D|nr:Cmx/CmrA family chloramphenicol efflux MFS transporter [Streptomyces sp. SID5785]MZD09033.1 Cmx/CmrA family chloramphenicol efflux MFS transporter [Streptomyces sp. SID5785]
MPLPLFLLALAVFAMGTSEFMLAGLLPDLAAGFGVPVGTAGLLTTAFAAGLAVGAPLMAVLARRRDPRTALLLSVLVFAAAHVVGAVTTDFGVLLATRVVAALADAGFLAVALTTAAALVAPDRKGRALGVLLSGTTLATVLGVPGGAALGALLGPRAPFWAVALLCVLAGVGLLRGLPSRAAADGPVPLRRELAQLARPALLLPMLLAALVNAATFAGLTFLAPVVTGPAGLGERGVPVALVLFGLGSFAGVTVAGRLADRHPGRVLAVGGPLLLAGWPALALAASRPAVLLAVLLVQGAAAFAVGSTLVTRVLYAAGRAPALAGAYGTASLNTGAAVGPLLGSAALGAGGGPVAPFWVGAALTAVASVVAGAAVATGHGHGLGLRSREFEVRRTV